MIGISEIYTKIFSLYVETLRKNEKVRMAAVILLSILLVAAISSLVWANEIFSQDNVVDARASVILALVFVSILWLLSLLSYTNYSFNDVNSLFDVEGIRKENEKIKERIEKQENNVLDTIQLSLNQLKEYYTVNLSQAKSSYRWSITAVMVGLVTLLVGIWILYFQEEPNITIAVISGASGILLEFIGAANIFIYNKSIKQLNVYFGELIKIQDTMLAIELCEGLSDSEPRKLLIKEKIILTLMGRSSYTDKSYEEFKRSSKSSTGE